MAWLAAAFLVAYLATLGLAFLLVRDVVRPYVERAFVLWERVPEGTGPGEALPHDILAHVNRLQRPESREAEAGYFRELFAKHGDWAKVRVAAGLAGNAADGDADGDT